MQNLQNERTEYSISPISSRKNYFESFKNATSQFSKKQITNDDYENNKINDEKPNQVQESPTQKSQDNQNLEQIKQKKEIPLVAKNKQSQEESKQLQEHLQGIQDRSLLIQKRKKNQVDQNFMNLTKESINQMVNKRERQQKVQNINIVDINNPEHQEIVIQILKDKNKTIKDITFLKKAISDLPLFQKNPDLLNKHNITQILLNEFSYEKFSKHQVIFNFGDFGYTYYIVLKGAVYLMIPKLTKDDNREEKDKNQKKKVEVSAQSLQKSTSNNSVGSKTPITESSNLQRQNSRLNRISSQIFESEKQKESKWKIIKQNLDKLNNSDGESFSNNIADQEEEEEDESDYLKRVYDDMNLIKTFVAGEAFGEIALMTKQRRTGTMVCKEETHLMTLTKNGFDKILGQYHEQIKIQRLGFLKSYSFFNNIPNSNLLSILLDIKIEVYPKKALLFAQGDEVKNIFFIKRGEIQISRLIQSDQSANTQNEGEANSYEKKNISSSNKIIDKYNHTNKQKNVKQHQRQILITSQGTNSHIGCEDLADHILNNLQSNNLSKFIFYHSNVAEVISQEVEVYKLNKHIFLNNLYMFKSVEEFAKQIKEKNQYYNQRLQKVIQAKGSSEEKMKNLIQQIDSKKIDNELELQNTSRSALNLSYQNGSQDNLRSPASYQSSQLTSYYFSDFPLEDNVSERSLSLSQRQALDEKPLSLKNNFDSIIQKDFSPNNTLAYNRLQRKINSYDGNDFGQFFPSQRPNSQFSQKRRNQENNFYLESKQAMRNRMSSVQNSRPSKLGIKDSIIQANYQLIQRQQSNKEVNIHDQLYSLYPNKESIFLPEIENRDGTRSNRSSLYETSSVKQSPYVSNAKIFNNLQNYKIQNQQAHTCKSRNNSQFNLQNEFYQVNNAQYRGSEYQGKMNSSFNTNSQASSFSKYVLNFQKLQEQNNQLDCNNMCHTDRTGYTSSNQIQISPRENNSSNQYIMNSTNQHNIFEGKKVQKISLNSNENNFLPKNENEDTQLTLRKSDKIPADIQLALNQENPLLKSQKVIQLMKKQSRQKFKINLDLELKIKRQFLQNAKNFQHGEIKASSSMFPSKQIENIKDLNVNLFGEQSKYHHIILMQQLCQLEIRNPQVVCQNNGYEYQQEDQKYFQSEKEQSFLNYKKSAQIPAQLDRAQTNLIKYFQEKQKDQGKLKEQSQTTSQQHSLQSSPIKPKTFQIQENAIYNGSQIPQDNQQRAKSRDPSPQLPQIFSSFSTPVLLPVSHSYQSSKIHLLNNKFIEKKEQSRECKNIHTNIARQNKKQLKGLVKMIPHIKSASLKKIKNIRNKLESDQLTYLNTTPLNKSQQIK
ncbi:cyclic nucleotide-binding domain protein (macronuclear) [Tetrahymena thermophila SB210]|uniref:Cyclic nucleotide-binding domain protein n=1 Tax=Tetrahymena thermophila (strain SB210) TaxID=312017 RepID=A4VDG7_TETTS|nr:cyclic nucleotide-binding domain protein [Tetrahymena thermophila SB210]EDK31573.2 cyclic nucleotide-binding domain protein [Tetrahymena thermophila SB210]|eukprot:XP_001471424.2 cyclic nucleotide-binding domain protein [Tetrahymena thermophila SB210]